MSLPTKNCQNKKSKTAVSCYDPSRFERRSSNREAERPPCSATGRGLPPKDPPQHRGPPIPDESYHTPRRRKRHSLSPLRHLHGRRGEAMPRRPGENLPQISQPCCVEPWMPSMKSDGRPKIPQWLIMPTINTVLLSSLKATAPPALQ